MPSKLRIGLGMFGSGNLPWTTGSLTWRRGLPVKSGGSSGFTCACPVPCDRPRLRTGGEMAFLYDLPTVMPWGFAPLPFAGFAGVPLAGPVELANCDAGPDMWLPNTAADCADVPERLFPARAIAARNSAANSAPAIVFRLGARITESPFRSSGRIRFVLLPSILLWPSEGNRGSVLDQACCRRRATPELSSQKGRARSRAGKGMAGDASPNLNRDLSRPPPMSPPWVGYWLPDTKAAPILGDTARSGNGPADSFSAQRKN